ncbi:hypothetical protein SKA58_16888 [Sphingomonas sp. SKA58]|uniref:hypothetical protein n=1 Tax=Sphingomonas sp. (strain SKA58) TaxID=314266 RepID=UPI0000D7A654|nr:hypothetical protein [Sphingomonas sp. SKA58]EAT08874.1 hypothetical protein SKA58_16888 [Sphingomonas sp. SKA58]
MDFRRVDADQADAFSIQTDGIAIDDGYSSCQQENSDHHGFRSVIFTDCPGSSELAGASTGGPSLWEFWPFASGYSPLPIEAY